MTWLDAVQWNADGLIPVIAQDDATGQVLTLAWMNRAALAETVKRGEVIYWSRSRQKLWHKGETSGFVQKVRSLRLDCDRDALLIRVEPIGGIACHTGRYHCFYHEYDNGNWVVRDPVLQDPNEIYR